MQDARRSQDRVWLCSEELKTSTILSILEFHFLFYLLNCISNHSLFNPTASKLVPCWLRFIIPLQTSLHFHTFPMWQIQKVTSSYIPGDHPQTCDYLRIHLLNQPLHVRLSSYCLTTSENSQVFPTRTIRMVQMLATGLWAIWIPLS